MSYTICMQFGRQIQLFTGEHFQSLSNISLSFIFYCLCAIFDKYSTILNSSPEREFVTHCYGGQIQPGILKIDISVYKIKMFLHFGVCK